MIGHAEEWHFLIPGVQLRFNDFHCLELRGGSGEAMQRIVCHLKQKSISLAVNNVKDFVKLFFIRSKN